MEEELSRRENTLTISLVKECLALAVIPEREREFGYGGIQNVEAAAHIRGRGS